MYNVFLPSLACPGHENKPHSITINRWRCWRIIYSFANNTYVCDVQTVFTAASNSCIQTWDISATAFGKSPVITHGYVYLNHALFTFLPLVILVLFNALLVKSLLKAARERYTLTSTGMKSSSASASASMTDLACSGHGTGGSGLGTSGSDHRITVMLIVVSAVFLVCQVHIAE